MDMNHTINGRKVRRRNVWLPGLACAALLGLPLGGCVIEDKDGPLEEVGEELDDAAEDVKDAVEDATDGN
jgi:hypothetical protein